MKNKLSYLILILLFVLACSAPKKCCSQIKDIFKFSTFYVASNGGTSLADENVYSVNNSFLSTDTVTIPYDYSLSMGIRKIQRFPVTIQLPLVFCILLQTNIQKDFYLY